MSRRPRVALLIETSNAYARGLLTGISAFAREKEWSVFLPEHRRGEGVPPWLRRWDGDGIIARIENSSIARAVVASGLPAVDVSAARLVPPLPWVETDDETIARLAAEHLLGRGFRHLGFCGLSNFNWSKHRCRHFQEAVRERGAVCHVHMVPAQSERRGSWEADERELTRWVRRLPRPIGIMACFDIRGQQLLEACRRANVDVPDEVAVIGVDNDTLLCELSDPPLSSVVLDTYRTGRIAAELLDRMMAGKTVAGEAHLIPPLGIAARRSTDALAIEDPDIVSAVRFIRDNACRGIGVEDVLEVVALSRRVLESRFVKRLGRSPHDVISDIQVERVKDLLMGTSLPLKTIARQTGFRHAEYMSVAFKRATGMAPGAYRKSRGERGER